MSNLKLHHKKYILALFAHPSCEPKCMWLCVRITKWPCSMTISHFTHSVAPLQSSTHHHKSMFLHCSHTPPASQNVCGSASVSLNGLVVWPYHITMSMHKSSEKVIKRGNSAWAHVPSNTWLLCCPCSELIITLRVRHERWDTLQSSELLDPQPRGRCPLRSGCSSIRKKTRKIPITNRYQLCTWENLYQLVPQCNRSYLSYIQDNPEKPALFRKWL